MVVDIFTKIKTRGDYVISSKVIWNSNLGVVLPGCQESQCAFGELVSDWLDWLLVDLVAIENVVGGAIG
jgi:hypothetical protein